MTRHHARSRRSPNLESVLAELRPPKAVAKTSRRMARAALWLGADLGRNTWKAIVLSLRDRLSR